MTGVSSGDSYNHTGHSVLTHRRSDTPLLYTIESVDSDVSDADEVKCRQGGDQGSVISSVHGSDTDSDREDAANAVHSAVPIVIHGQQYFFPDHSTGTGSVTNWKEDW